MFMKAFSAQTYAFMRIVVGFLFLWHGTQKLFSFPSAMPFEAPAFIPMSQDQLNWSVGSS